MTAFGLGLEYHFEDTGFASLEKHGSTLRDETIELARTFDGIILGPQSHMDYPPRDKGGGVPEGSSRSAKTSLRSTRRSCTTSARGDATG